MDNQNVNTNDSDLVKASTDLLDRTEPAEIEKGMKLIEAYRELAVSTGMPVPRELFEGMVSAAAATKKQKKKWRRALAKELPDKNMQQGCIGMVAEGVKVFFVLKPCGPDHDLDAQLEKIFTRIPESRRSEVLKHMSALVQMGRSTYSAMVAKLSPVLEPIQRSLPPEFNAHRLMIDPANTTIFLQSSGPNRVGIFIDIDTGIDTDTGTGTDTER